MIKVCTSGYMNPLHVGHLELFKQAKALGDYLIVIVNNDEQVKLKGSVPFMNQIERCEIVDAIRYVDEVVLSIDHDRTICKTLAMVQPDVFAKGGDSTPDNVPEKEVCDVHNIKLAFGIGGGKIQSSSTLIKNANDNRTHTVFSNREQRISN